MMRPLAVLALVWLTACSRETPDVSVPADLVLTNARVYTLDWPDPAVDGSLSPQAPHGPGWRPDASALAGW